MAHQLEVANGKASMFFVGETPWHGLGTPLEKAPTSAEAIVAAGLDWKVGLKPLYAGHYQEDGPHNDLVTGGDQNIVAHKATYRETDGKILGVVGPSWKPLQNADAFSFFDPFVASGQANYETAGALNGGRRVWILAAIAGDPLVVKGDDEIRRYLLLSNSHDGTIAIRAGFTPVRVVCANTLAMAHHADASALVRITHHSKSVEALDKLRDVMNTVNARFEATVEDYRILASKGCNEADLKKYVNLVFAPKRVKDEMAKASAEEKALSADQLRSLVYPKIAELFESGRGSEMAGVRGTLWGAYNAINEYIVHTRGKDAEKRLDSTWFGQGAVQNALALKVGVQLASVA